MRGAVVHAAPPLHSRPLGQLLDGRANHIVFTRLFGSVNLFVNRRMAPSLRLLADRIGVPASVLKSTVDEYNRCALSGQPDPMGKSAELFRPLGPGPYACRAISTACCSRRRASHWEASTSMPANGCCGRTEPASTASSPPVGVRRAGGTHRVSPSDLRDLQPRPPRPHEAGQAPDDRVGVLRMQAVEGRLQDTGDLVVALGHDLLVVRRIGAVGTPVERWKELDGDGRRHRKWWYDSGGEAVG